MNEEDLMLAYRKLHAFLNLRTRPHLGITLIIAPEWMFLSTISQPYHREQYLDIDGNDLEGGVPVYLDGFAFSGVLNIQLNIEGWPATAGIGGAEHTVLGSLEK